MDGDAQVARTEVVTGRVDAVAGATSMPIDAGFGVVAAANAPLAPPRPMPATPDLSGVPARITRLPVRAAWPVAPGVRRSRVQLFVDGTEGAQVFDQVVDVGEVRWPALDDGAYRLRVRAIDEAGSRVTMPRPASKWTRGRSLRLPMRRPTRVVSTANSTEFRWTKSEAAAAYDLQVATEPAFAAPLVDVVARADVSDTHRLPPGLYYWRVASRTATGERGPFGDPVSFTQRKYPDGRTASADIEKTTLTLRWSSGEPGETSHFQLASDREFAHVLVDRTLPESQVTVPRPDAGTYFLRVRALDTDGVAGQYGPVQQIDVPKLPRRHSWWWLVPPAAAAAFFLVLL